MNKDGGYIHRNMLHFLPFTGQKRFLVQSSMKQIEFNILTCCFFFNSASRPFGRKEYRLLDIGLDPAFYYSIKDLLDKGYIVVASVGTKAGHGSSYQITPKGERFLLEVAKQARKNHKVLRELLPEYFPDFYRLRKKRGPKKKDNADNQKDAI